MSLSRASALIVASGVLAMTATANSVGDAFRTEAQRAMGRSFGEFSFITHPLSGIQPGDIYRVETRSSLFSTEGRRLPWFTSPQVLSVMEQIRLSGLASSEQSRLSQLLVSTNQGGWIAGGSSTGRTYSLSASAVLSWLRLGGRASGSRNVTVRFSWTGLRRKNLMEGNMPTVAQALARSGLQLNGPAFRGKGIKWMLHSVIEVDNLTLTLDAASASQANITPELLAIGSATTGGAFQFSRNANGDYVLTTPGSAVIAAVAREHNNGPLMDMFGLKN